MKSAFVVLFTTAFVFCLNEKEYEREYSKWMESYGKQRSNGPDITDRKKFENFKNNLDKVLAHNSTESGFELGLNEFSDMSLDEFQSEYMGKSHMFRRKKRVMRNSAADYSSMVFPPSFDYRDMSAVNPVRRQNGCGACYAITSTGSIEGATFLKTKKLPLLSPQQLIDCSSGFGNEGCKGGDMINSFNYTMETGGLYDDWCYPFADKLGKCQTSEISLSSKRAGDSEKKCGRTTIQDMYDVEEGNELDLAYALLTYGPLGVGLDSTQPSFALYKGGIYEDKRCNKDKICHAMLLVGYGTDKTSGKKYWILRNSWGTSWGVDGYLLLKKDSHDMCGVSSYACAAVVK